MRIKTKKQDQKDIVRLETYGGLKEVIVKEDIFNSKGNLVELCFRGENSSGIVELTADEIERINAEFQKGRKQISKNVKVMKFKK